MKRVLGLFLCMVIFLSGCASLSGYDKIKYDRLKLKLERCKLPELTPKKPGIAAALNILPGIGNVYLGQWGMFAANLLLWPWSVPFSIPQAGVDAGNLNKKETLLHYEHGFGADELKSCEPGLPPAAGGAFTPEERKQMEEDYMAKQQEKERIRLQR